MHIFGRAFLDLVAWMFLLVITVAALMPLHRKSTRSTRRDGNGIAGKTE
jgi:hypothetical protein